MSSSACFTIEIYDFKNKAVSAANFPNMYKGVTPHL